jgi:hypothetical protein
VTSVPVASLCSTTAVLPGSGRTATSTQRSMAIGRHQPPV